MARRGSACFACRVECAIALSDLDGAVRDLDAAAALKLDGFQPSSTETAMVRRIAALALIQGGRLDRGRQAAR